MYGILVVGLALVAGRSDVPTFRRSVMPGAERPNVRTSERPALAPCIRVTRAGTEVRGDTKVCPGRYRVRDANETGVLVVKASGVHLDLTGVIFESADSVPSLFVGIGVLGRSVDSVFITGGTVRGYRFGVLLEGGRGHQVTGMTLSGSRRQALRSTRDRYDERDWLDIFHPDTFEAYGGGLYLKNVHGAIIIGNTARDAQNGIGLFEARGVHLVENDVSENSGWGIHLWRASQNTIVRNRAGRNVRCEGDSYSRGCDSAGLLLRQRSDSNLIADNDLRWSGDGFFLSGHQPGLESSTGNLVLRNDASHAYHNAFEATWSWGTVFLDNRADSAAFGFWLGYSSNVTVRGNTAIGTRRAAIAIEHGSDNEIAGNTLIGGEDGIRLFAPTARAQESRGYRVDDNVVARFGRGLVLEGTTQVRARGNVFDGNRESLVADEAAKGTVLTGNTFLRPGGSYIRAPELDAGNNYWDTVSPGDTRPRLAGRINIEPWRPASAGGF
jgi:parallel beta-helix repeat protein